MKVKLISYSNPSTEILNEGVSSITDLISFCARVSNPGNQTNTETADRLIKYLIKNKHFSPFEMCNICLEIETTRDISRQILRHRSFSFQEFCLSGDTDIYFADNSKIKIRDLYENKKLGENPLKCLDENNKIITANIKEVFNTGKKDVYKILLKDGKEIKSTAEHKFYTKNGFKSLQEITGLNLSKNEEIAIEDNISIAWTTIKYIEYLGQEDTYDLEVNHSSHNYVANGIIVHNSQRYADPVKELEFTLREARLQDYKNRQNSIEIDDEKLQKEWDEKQTEIIEKSKEVYQWALEHGIAKEQARSVLPEGNTITRLYMNGTIRSWIHYIELRTDPSTQKEHREVAKACAEAICKMYPHLVVN